MPFIDWSDSEGLLELLSEYVRDELTECRNDAKRKKFLSILVAKINGLMPQCTDAKKTAHSLIILRKSIPPEFEEDPVTVHINDCIQELDPQ